jgi:hypothetical protein
MAWRYYGETLLHSGEKPREKNFQTKYVLAIKAPERKEAEEVTCNEP